MKTVNWTSVCPAFVNTDLAVVVMSYHSLWMLLCVIADSISEAWVKLFIVTKDQPTKSKAPSAVNCTILLNRVNNIVSGEHSTFKFWLTFYYHESVHDFFTVRCGECSSCKFLQIIYDCDYTFPARYKINHLDRI